jgi:hypothetical protein
MFVRLLIGFCLIFGVALWWFQTRAYYEQIDGLTEVSAYGDAFEVSDYRSIDADTSPLKLRACFTVDWDYWPSDEYAQIAEPLQAPSWFDCFDAGQIAAEPRPFSPKKTSPSALTGLSRNMRMVGPICGGNLTNVERQPLLGIRSPMGARPNRRHKRACLIF